MLRLNVREQMAVVMLLKAYAAGPGYCLLHRGEGLVIEFERAGQALILKLISPAAQVGLDARLDWIAYLGANGICVPALVETRAGGHIARVVLDEEAYTAYAYAKLPLGDENQIDWGDARMPVQLGKLVAKMHNLARGYPRAAEFPTWDEADWLRCPAGVFHPSQAALVEPLLRLRDRLRSAAVLRQDIGLIHADLHTGNVFRAAGDLVVLDFDSCHRAWFAADLAYALLFRVWIGPEKEALTEEARAFLSGLIEGYRRLAPMPAGWQELFPSLLKLREISLYQSFYRDQDAAGRGGDPFFQYLFKSICQERPFLNLDWDSL
jgi:Ser/Thr protein kinase RdoA (MazF antagonist)